MKTNLRTHPPRHLRAVAAPSSSYGGAVGPPPGWRLSPTTSGQGSGGRISLFAFRMRIACEFAAKRIGPPHFRTPFRIRKCSENGCTTQVQSSRPETLKCGAGRVSCVQVTTDQMQFRSHGHAVFSTHQSMVGPWARGPCGLIGTHRRPRRSLSTGARRPTRSTSRSRWVGQLI